MGDTIALSVTPEYLVQIGLLDKVPDPSKDIGLLLNKALEKKKVVGSVHMAIGTGAALGGKYRSTLHLDGLMLKPVVTIDGKILFKEGQLKEK